MGQPEPVRLVDARPTGPAPVMIGAVLDRALETALTLLRADRGNIQIVDPATGALRIAVHHGFSAAFLEYFAVVGDDGSACGRAATGLSPTVIADVRGRSGLRAAQGNRGLVTLPARSVDTADRPDRTPSRHNLDALSAAVPPAGP